MELTTTVVGSYPSKPDRKLLESSYRTREDPFVESIKKAVKAQIDAGVHLVSDGQTRGDMISIFTSGLRGFRFRERIQVVSKVSYKGPITVADQRLVKKLLPEGVELKGIITGPYTITTAVKDFHYESKEECMFDIADALHQEAEALSSVCSVIQLDEPFLSVEYDEKAKEAVEKVLDVDVKTALHVCGDVSNIVNHLVEFDVDILDHEFTQHPHLYDVYGDLQFSQQMAVGVVSTEAPVEKVETIAERVERVLDAFGPDSLIDPDCGLRNLPEEVARKKLNNMVKAREMVLNERS